MLINPINREKRRWWKVDGNQESFWKGCVGSWYCVREVVSGES